MAQHRVRTLADIDRAGIEQNRSVLEQADDGAGGKKPADMGAARNSKGATIFSRFRQTALAIPSGSLAHLIQAVGQSVGGNRLAAKPTIALALEISQSKLDRIEAERIGDLVDLGLAGECHLRNAEAAERAEAYLVGVGKPAVTIGMRDAVGAAARSDNE